ncbi:hypothetical protein J6590_017180 [Homalodisca vitripennis]|nr:hypothetical protein J6590_017180 [Homalodisca vitripennis]
MENFRVLPRPRGHVTYARHHVTCFLAGVDWELTGDATCRKDIQASSSCLLSLNQPKQNLPDLHLRVVVLLHYATRGDPPFNAFLGNLTTRILVNLKYTRERTNETIIEELTSEKGTYCSLQPVTFPSAFPNTFTSRFPRRWSGPNELWSISIPEPYVNPLTNKLM